MTDKQEWPELLGTPYKDAVRIIETERPHVIAVPVQWGVEAVTMDLRYDRVWVWYDPATKTVKEIPRIG